jgi:hypothetical protein
MVDDQAFREPIERVHAGEESAAAGAGSPQAGLENHPAVPLWETRPAFAAGRRRTDEKSARRKKRRLRTALRER